jgi:glucuronoarabinoxylan endo-1,4-beta-xylanase
VQQVIDGFGATEPLYPNPNLTSAQRSTFFGLGPSQLGLSLLRVAVTDDPSSTPTGYAPGNCASISTSCAGKFVADMQAIIAQGGRVYGSPWSPPAMYKTNSSLPCTAGGGSGALATGSYANYATWLAHFVQSLSQEYGISLYALSIQNEPDQCKNYDSALYTAAQLDTFIETNLGPTFSANGLSTLVFTPETSGYSALTGGNGGGTCFTDSPCYAFTSGANWHDYDATGNSSGSGANSASNPWSLGQKYWETEVACGNGYGPSSCESGTAYVTDMTTDGLMWANIIDNRMAVQNANAYLYFAFVSGNDNLGLSSNTTSTLPARAYVFGQYSKFIRPGYYRVAATHAPQSSVSVSAYQNTGNGTIVIVATNYSGSTKGQGFSITNAPTFSSVTPYITSQSLNIAQQSAVSVSGNTFSYTLPAYSVTTFVGTASSSTVGNPTISPAAGNYAFPLSVSVSGPTVGATYCVTTDGSTPAGGGGGCTNGTTYTGAFSLASPATVKAIGILSGSTNSGVVSNTYTATSPPAPPTGVSATAY